MKHLLRYSMLLVMAFLSPAYFAGAQTDDKEAYIRKYSEIAVSEMKRSGVPASITLAQGLLESGAGKSTLARQANNHFGIKCHSNWKGRTVYHDDDAKGECFRAYDNAEESFRDHSDFLRYRDRYKFLFDYEPTDYKSWCYGLKKAGYATDPKYATKLIGIVEKYNLDRFDTVKVAVISPDILERPVLLPVKTPAPIRYDEEFSFEVDRTVYQINGVDFVYARGGDTYESIAREYRLFHKEILRFNDLPSDIQLVPGQIVYIKAKKSKTVKGLDMYIVSEDGESLWSICQRFGVKMKSVMKLNGIKPGYSLARDQELRLR